MGPNLPRTVASTGRKVRTEERRYPREPVATAGVPSGVRPFDEIIVVTATATQSGTSGVLSLGTSYNAGGNNRWHNVRFNLEVLSGETSSYLFGVNIRFTALAADDSCPFGDIYGAPEAAGFTRVYSPQVAEVSWFSDKTIGSVQFTATNTVEREEWPA